MYYTKIERERARGRSSLRWIYTSIQDEVQARVNGMYALEGFYFALAAVGASTSQRLVLNLGEKGVSEGENWLDIKVYTL